MFGELLACRHMTKFSGLKVVRTFVVEKIAGPKIDSYFFDRNFFCEHFLLQNMVTKSVDQNAFVRLFVIAIFL